MRYDRPESLLFKKTKEEIKKRDKHKCQLCNKRKKWLEVHHIRTWAGNVRLRFDPLNLICLCFDCHKKIKGKEDYYIPMLSVKAKENAKNYYATRRPKRSNPGQPE